MEKKQSKRNEITHTPYIDGVNNQNDEQVIRPLNQDERDWINKFNNEFGNASFNNDSSDLHHDMIQANKEAVAALKIELKKVSAEIRKVDNGYREMNGVERLDYREYKKDLHIQKNDLVAQLEKINIRAGIDNSKNKRRKDVSNSSRTTNISDLASGNFLYVDDGSILANSSESELFDRLKNSPIIED